MIPFTTASKKNLGINSNKKFKELHNENFKTLEIEGDTTRWKDLLYALIGRIINVKGVKYLKQYTNSMQSL